MAVKEIKTRFKLEGEQQFKKAMSDSAAAVKVLNSEEKLAEAQFKATGDAESYAAEKSRILKEQIKQQQVAVKAAEDAVKELTKNGVQPNSTEMQKWRTKLNNAKTKLVNMEDQLQKTETELKDQKNAVKDASDATGKYNDNMDKVAQGIDLQNTILAIDNLKGHIESVVTKAAQAAKALFEMGADAGKWADDLVTAATQAGIDVETYQSWQYASRFIDTSVNDIVSSFGDIDKKLKEEGESAKKYRESLAEIGVATYRASGEMRDSNEIFWDAIDGLHGITDAGELARKATLIFGNDWRKLQPLIEAGSKGYEEVAEQGRQVAVVGAEQVAALGEVDDAMQDMQARADKLKYDALAALAPVFKDVAEAMAQAMTALDDFVQSEEGREALESLSSALTGIINAFLGEDNGKGTFESIVNGAKDAVNGLTEALTWISNNGETVKGIITGLGTAWAGLTVAKEVLLFMQLLQFTPLSKLTAIFGGDAANAGAEVATNAAADAATATPFIATAAPVALAVGTALAVGYGVNEGTNELARLKREAREARMQAMEEDTALTNETEILEAYNAVEQARQTIVDATGKAGGVTLEMVKEVTESEGFKKAVELLGMGDTDFANEFQLGGFSRLVGGWGYEGLLGDMSNTLSDMAESAAVEVEKDAEYGGDRLERLKTEAESAKTAVQELYKELNEKYGVIQNGQTGQFELLNSDNSADANAGIKLLNELYTKAAELKTKYEEAGKAVPQGLAAGIEEETSTAETAAQSLAEKTVKVVSTKLLINSPSKVMEAMGQNVSIGLANGINSRAGVAVAAAQALANRVTAIIQSALQIHSPSAVMEELGMYTGEGFAIGLARTAGDVDRAAGRMLSAVRAPLRYAPESAISAGMTYRSSGAQGGSQSAPGAPMAHVTLMLDKEVLADTMVPLVDQKFGAKIQATRRG